MTQRDTGHPTDNAFLGPLKGGSMEPTYGGALSFMRRRYSRDLAGVDAVVWGIPFDSATTNRPGARFGPRAIRLASSIFDGDPQYPFGFDLFETLAVVDYGDCGFDYGRPMEVADEIERQAAAIIGAGAQLFSLGGDHFVTYPLIKAHAKRYGKLALIQFDAHQDTWVDDEGRISPRDVHRSRGARRADRPGAIDPGGHPHTGAARSRHRHHHRVRHRCARPAAGGRMHRGARGERAGVPHLRHRLPRPGVRAGNRHAGRRRAIESRGSGDPAGLGSVDFCGGDVVEVSPPYDHAEITAIAGATVAMFYMGLLAERRRR